MATGLFGLTGKQDKDLKKWEKMYYDAKTSDAKRAELFKKYGTKYGWKTPQAVSQYYAGQQGGGSTASNNQFVKEAQPLVDAQVDTIKSTAPVITTITNPNEVSTFGSKTITVDPVTGQPTITTSLSPHEQDKLDRENWLDIERYKTAGDMWTNQIKPALQKPMDLSGVPKLANQDNLENARIRTEDRIYADYKKKLDEGFAESQKQLQESLLNRGIPPGSPRYQKEMQGLIENQSRQYTDATMAARSEAGTELDRQYNQSVTSRNQGLGEAYTARNQPFKEYWNIRGNGSTVNMPTFTPWQGQQIGIPDTAGLGFGFAGLQNQENIANIQGDTSRAVAGVNAGASQYGANLDYQLGNKQLDLQYGSGSGINWNQEVRQQPQRQMRRPPRGMFNLG